MIHVLDLFSGIGGFSLGLESTGHFKTIGFCEIEPFPREVLRKHWPDVPIWEDVRELTAESLGGLRPDAIVGGFPCQDISVAGKGAGIEGSRSGLWGEFARLVGELRPRWVLAENVGALRTRGMDRVCSDLEAEGYAVWPLVVGAWAVGAPHRRERVWIVAQRTSGEERVAHGDRGRPQGERDADGDTESGVRAEPSGDQLDGRGEWPVGEPTGTGLEGQRADAGQPQEPQPENSGSRPARIETASETALGAVPKLRQLPVQDSSNAHARLPVPTSRGVESRPIFGWPARPGEPQHEWEEPRLACGMGGQRHARWRDGESQSVGRDGTSEGFGEPGLSQLPLGGSVDGLSLRLARRWNRESLKALGNSVVPQVVAVIGQAIAEVD